MDLIVGSHSNAILTVIEECSTNMLVMVDYVNSGEHEVSLSCTRNAGWEAREAVLEIRAGKTVTPIKIRQRPQSMAEPKETYTEFTAEGGHQDIRIRTNGNLSSSIISDKLGWLEYELVERNGESFLSLNLHKNRELGRVAFIKIYTDGEYSSTVVVYQRPDKFPSTVDIVVSGPGQLYVLFGEGRLSYHDIRKLTILGTLNALDFYVLSKFNLTGALGDLCPLEVDLSGVTIANGNTCYYPDYPIDPATQQSVISVSNHVFPMVCFSRSANLRSIVLPNSLEAIEPSSFSWCRNLTSIEIPADVISIGNNTFLNCKNLADISIPPYSMLSTIGRQAFSQCRNLSSLYIPTSVTNISEDAFRGCKIGTLWVNWENPPELKYMPEVDTLIVPTGLKAVYEMANKWREYNVIIEKDLE